MKKRQAIAKPKIPKSVQEPIKEPKKWGSNKDLPLDEEFHAISSKIETLHGTDESPKNSIKMRHKSAVTQALDQELSTINARLHGYTKPQILPQPQNQQKLRQELQAIQDRLDLLERPDTPAVQTNPSQEPNIITTSKRHRDPLLNELQGAIKELQQRLNAPTNTPTIITQIPESNQQQNLTKNSQSIEKQQTNKELERIEKQINQPDSILSRIFKKNTSENPSPEQELEDLKAMQEVRRIAAKIEAEHPIPELDELTFLQQEIKRLQEQINSQ